jgi:hypothetical protein
LATFPRLQLHFTLTNASWLNLVERRFGLIAARAIRRISFDCVRRLEQAITRYRAQWNETTKPFPWTNSAAKIRRGIRDAKPICDNHTSGSAGASYGRPVSLN